ncbi:RNase H domain protein [Penicillium chermesinum]|nr:RNase H domain protein [Penicillium chermesinum]
MSRPHQNLLTACDDTKFPSRFKPPPRTHHSDLFIPHALTDTETRLVNHTNPQQLLITTDGACNQNAWSSRRGGWAFVYGPSSIREYPGANVICERLEKEGPNGHAYAATNHRAELRAVIAALQWKNWAAEGFTSLWVRNGFVTPAGLEVANLDLWKVLLQVVDWVEYEVLFWRVGQRVTGVADHFARVAAEKASVVRFKVWVEGGDRFEDSLSDT